MVLVFLKLAHKGLHPINSFTTQELRPKSTPSSPSLIVKHYPRLDLELIK